MRIGIITFSYTDNVGSALQTFALQTIISKICSEKFSDYEVEIINYEKKSWLGNYVPSFKHFLNNPYCYVIRFLILTRVYLFNRFQRKYLKFGTKHRIKDRTILLNLNHKYDCFVAGSDQIWNISISRVDYSYFLDFVNDYKLKIAYAPSFGGDSIQVEHRSHIVKLLKRFDSLSSRESMGVSLIKELTQRNASLVLDPTLLFSKEEWKLMLPFKESASPKYILLYLRDHLPTIAIDFAEKLSQKTGLKILKIHGTTKGRCYWHVVGPKEWLSLLTSAEYVITNSFHAVIFSINFHKNFYVDANQNTSRITSILKMTRLENRFINNTDINNDPIDFEYSDLILKQKRIESINYLTNSILKCKSTYGC